MSEAPSFAFIRIEVPCAGCGKGSLQLLKDAIENDAVTCTSCGASIDLTTEKWREFLKQAEQFYRGPGESA